jgi:hypothetical protein
VLRLPTARRETRVTIEIFMNEPMMFQRPSGLTHVVPRLCVSGDSMLLLFLFYATASVFWPALVSAPTIRDSSQAFFPRAHALQIILVFADAKGRARGYKRQHRGRRLHEPSASNPCLENMHYSSLKHSPRAGDRRSSSVGLASRTALTQVRDRRMSIMWRVYAACHSVRRTGTTGVL